jgi:ribosome recycling factor
MIHNKIEDVKPSNLNEMENEENGTHIRVHLPASKKESRRDDADPEAI